MTRAERRRALATCAALALGGALLTACGTSPAASVRPPVASSAASPVGPSAPSSPAPPFEADPEVVTVRTYFAASMRAVNSGDWDAADLLAVSTPDRAQHTQVDFGRFLAGGGVAPGPMPFTVIGVAADSPTVHRVQVCGYDTGWLRDPTTGQRTQDVVINGGDVTVQLSDGAWRVDAVADVPSRDCSGVLVQDVTW